MRSRVDGEVAVGEWPPASAFDDGPVRRYVMRIPELPERMRAADARDARASRTFVPAGPGVAVEIGLPPPGRSCARARSSIPNGLVLLRGRGDEPWTLERLPQMGDLRAFARVELRGDDARRRVDRDRRRSSRSRCACRCA